MAQHRVPRAGAAGSILYVIVQLLGVGLKMGHMEMLMWGLFIGLVLGFGTDFVCAGLIILTRRSEGLQTKASLLNLSNNSELLSEA